MVDAVNSSNTTLSPEAQRPRGGRLGWGWGYTAGRTGGGTGGDHLYPLHPACRGEGTHVMSYRGSVRVTRSAPALAKQREDLPRARPTHARR